MSEENIKEGLGEGISLSDEEKAAAAERIAVAGKKRIATRRALAGGSAVAVAVLAISLAAIASDKKSDDKVASSSTTMKATTSTSILSTTTTLPKGKYPPGALVVHGKKMWVVYWAAPAGVDFTEYEPRVRAALEEVGYNFSDGYGYGDAGCNGLQIGEASVSSLLFESENDADLFVTLFKKDGAADLQPSGVEYATQYCAD